MNKKNAKVLQAQETFQKLPPEKQKWIKQNEPEIYKTIFSEEILVDAKILDDFIDRYQPELSSLDRAQNVFQRMSIGRQQQVKNDDPKMYNALFDSGNNDNSILKQFLDKYEPLNEKITSIELLNELPLEEQVNFKNSYPDEYAKIMSVEPKEEGDQRTVTLGVKLSANKIGNVIIPEALTARSMFFEMSAEARKKIQNSNPELFGFFLGVNPELNPSELSKFIKENSKK